MGNCCDRIEDRNIYDDPEQERRPLLRDEGAARSDVGGISSGPKESDSGGNNRRGDKRGDEQSALNRILQSTADQVIDVGALDSRGLEQRDYLDRARQYSARLSLSVKPPPSLTHNPNSLSKVSSSVPPHTFLAGPPVSDKDYTMIFTLATRCANAVKEVTVTHQEELVVPFGIP